VRVCVCVCVCARVRVRACVILNDVLTFCACNHPCSCSVSAALVKSATKYLECRSPSFVAETNFGTSEALYNVSATHEV
jgi:hypothetical protein